MRESQDLLMMLVTSDSVSSCLLWLSDSLLFYSVFVSNTHSYYIMKMMFV